MSATLAPFGFRPAYHPSGLDRPKRYPITSGYATQLLKGVPVALDAVTNLGTIIIGTAGSNDLLGIFLGVEYTDPTGKPVVSNYWPASTTILSGTIAYAWVMDDPDVVYEVQADGSIPATAIGNQANFSNGTAGSTSTGLSAATLSSSLAGVGSQGQFRIIAVGGQPDNAWGDTYTIVQVELARSQYIANKVAV